MKTSKLQVHTVVLQTSIKKWLLSLSILVTVIGAIAVSLIPPIVLGNIVDTLTQSATLPVSMCILYFVTLLCGNLLESARDSLLVLYGQKITHALRSTLMNQYIHLDIHEISKQEPGSIVSRFILDVDKVEELFTSGIISMFADACKILSILAILWIKTRGLFYILLIVLPLVFLFTRHVQKQMLKNEVANRKAVSKTNSFLPESIHNIQTIHNLHKETYMEEKYNTYIEEGFQAINRTNFYDAIYSPVILSLNAIVVAAVVLLASSGNAQVLALFGMSAGSAVTVLNYISQIFTPIESLGMEIQVIQSAMAGVHRINEFFSLHLKQPGHSCNVQPSDNTVEIQNMSFGYDEKMVLQNFSLSITEGEHVTLQGRTGAGKSTLFKLILGLYTPEKGSVRVCNQEPYLLTPAERRSLFGYVEQSFHPVLGTIRDQITLYDDSITDEQVDTALKLTGLYTTVHSFEKGLCTDCRQELFSQGQWQILSIARAIVCNPSILMLDEITADLDSDTEHEILTTLAKVSKNRTVISISHRASATSGRIVQIG